MKRRDDGHVCIDAVSVDEGYADQDIDYVILWVCDGLGSKVRSVQIPVLPGPRMFQRRRELANRIRFALGQEDRNLPEGEQLEILMGSRS